MLLTMHFSWSIWKKDETLVSCYIFPYTHKWTIKIFTHIHQKHKCQRGATLKNQINIESDLLTRLLTLFIIFYQLSKKYQSLCHVTNSLDYLGLPMHYSCIDLHRLLQVSKRISCFNIEIGMLSCLSYLLFFLFLVVIRKHLFMGFLVNSWFSYRCSTSCFR